MYVIVHMIHYTGVFFARESSPASAVGVTKVTSNSTLSRVYGNMLYG